MKLHAQFPTRFIGNDPAKIKDWAQAAEDLGFDMIEVADHVFGASARGDWVPNYAETENFHETFVTIGFLAAVTERIGLSSGVLILPQRQTGLVAKQSAEADILSGGRLRLGIGVGWNHVEYEALDTDWKTRGARQAEQVDVLRQLWSGDLITYSGRFHNFASVNIMPPPVQRPIPIWFGGASDPVVRRAAQIGDGWMPILPAGDPAPRKVELFLDSLEACGRTRDDVGLEAWLRADSPDTQNWGAMVSYWRQLQADCVMLYPMFEEWTVEGQIEILRQFKEVAGS